jgi:hypothetical protein
MNNRSAENKLHWEHIPLILRHQDQTGEILTFLFTLQGFEDQKIVPHKLLAYGAYSMGHH